MAVLKNPTIRKLEDIVVSTNKDFVLMIAYLDAQKKHLEDIINEVKKYTKNRLNVEFYEIVLTSEQGGDVKKHFDVGHYPTLLVYSGGWLLYKTELLSAEKTEKVLNAVDDLPKLEFAREHHAYSPA